MEQDNKNKLIILNIVDNYIQYYKSDYILTRLKNIKDFINNQNVYCYGSIRNYIHTQYSRKLGGIEAIQISKMLSKLKTEITTNIKNEKC